MLYLYISMNYTNKSPWNFDGLSYNLSHQNGFSLDRLCSTWFQNYLEFSIFHQLSFADLIVYSVKISKSLKSDIGRIRFYQMLLMVPNMKPFNV